MTKAQALEKLQKFCAYQERCHHEVRSKILDLKIYGEWLEEIMAELVRDGYLNELRYARAYVGGKYRIKKWGRNKIIVELKRRKVSEYCIRKGLEEIDENLYYENLISMIKKYKSRLKPASTEWQKKNKIYQFAINKGFESELVRTAVNEIT